MGVVLVQANPSYYTVTSCLSELSIINQHQTHLLISMDILKKSPAKDVERLKTNLLNIKKVFEFEHSDNLPESLQIILLISDVILIYDHLSIKMRLTR